nr:hypothetical protein [Tanacetum cinerariifolium]
MVVSRNYDPKGKRSHTDPTLLNDSEIAAEGNGDLPVPDLQTIEELCQPSLNGRGGLIAPIAIQATHFGLDNDMIQQSIKVNRVTDDALRLYLFPHSLKNHATAWFDRLPRNSINTFEKMDKMFLAWERYRLLIDRRPNHNMFPVTQIDTFYNGLTLRRRDTINVAAGGTFMKRLQHSESSSSITSSSDMEIAALKAEMAKINKNLMRPPLAILKTYMLQEPIKVTQLPTRRRITTLSGTAYQGPMIPTTSSSLPPVVERKTEATKDMVHPTNNESTKEVQPPVVQIESPILNSKPVVAPIIDPVASPVSAPKPNQRPLIL